MFCCIFFFSLLCFFFFPFLGTLFFSFLFLFVGGVLQLLEKRVEMAMRWRCPGWRTGSKICEMERSGIHRGTGRGGGREVFCVLLSQVQAHARTHSSSLRNGYRGFLWFLSSALRPLLHTHRVEYVQLSGTLLQQQLLRPSSTQTADT